MMETFTEYQIAAERTINPMLTPGENTAHSLLGMASEVGELLGLYQKVYQGHWLDLNHVVKELGDLLWMMAEFCTANEISLSYVAWKNIQKLKERYPDGFDAEKSLHRAAGDV